VTTTNIPSYALDLYSDAAIAEPYEHYRALRELGPVVWLEQHQMYAVPRYAEARAVLSDDLVFRSANAIAMTDVVNAAMQGGTIATDGEVHAHLRRTVAGGLTPRALRPIRESVQTRADELASHVVSLGSFDAVGDLAQSLPLSIVPDFVGLPMNRRGRLLEWASANFDALGPANERCLASLPKITEMNEFAAEIVNCGDVLPDTLAERVLQAADRGEISEHQSIRLMLAYVAPSLDTTISAIGSAVWLFTQHPDQWQKLRDDPSLVPGAVNEIVRYETPIRALGRRAATKVDLGGMDLHEGDHLLVLYGSANRDERQWDQPDLFDVTRNAAGQLGFGHGVHSCGGQGLARIEIESLLLALSRQVSRFVLTGEPRRAMNNVIRAFDSVPVRIEIDATNETNGDSGN
jgi:cytochrome P450